MYFSGERGFGRVIVMNLLNNIFPFFRPFLQCPHCGVALEGNVQELRCIQDERHAFRVEDDFLTFAPHLDPGKYVESYAQRYAFLWAYGYQTRHSGLNESLYRTVSSLVAECLSARTDPSESPFIVDAGCGVGRVTTDCATLAPTSMVLGLDGSYTMLDLARAIVSGDAPVTKSLDAYGFGTLTIAVPAKPNVFFAQADVEDLPLVDSCADLILSINIIDRLPGGPEKALRECYRVLRPGGWLIFTDPLNWTHVRHWKAFGTAEDVGQSIEKHGFNIVTWFDDLLYHEILDARGSLEIFRAMVVKAQRPA